MRRHIVIFARKPAYGVVKTRLARDIGKLAALRFYRNTLFSVLHRLRTMKDTILHIAFDSDLEGKRQLYEPWPNLQRRFQGRGDLGDRMAHAFRQSPRGAATIIIGSDIPEITPHHIDTAFRALGRHDAVFGPSPDGGYWLIGVKNSASLPRAFLKKVRWSSPNTLKDSRASLPKHWKVAYITSLSDVDDGATYHAWRRKAHRTM